MRTGWIAAWSVMLLATDATAVAAQQRPAAASSDTQILFDASGRQIEKQPPARQASPRAAPREGQAGPKLGVETSPQVKSDKLPDGQNIPGTETYNHRRTAPPTFLGLSLSVPTDWLKPPQQ